MIPPPSDGDSRRQAPEFAPRRGPWRTAWRRFTDRVAVLADVRQHWWDFLTDFEEKPALRAKIYGALIALVALAAVTAWVYPRWRECRAVSVAQQWLAAGKLERAGPAVDAALREAPVNAEAWATLNSAVSRPFDKPKTGRIAVKVINHLGDEVMKVFRV